MNTKEQKLNPSTIAKNLGKTGRFIILHPESSGYSYKVFWQGDPEDKLEIVGSSPKIHKTKKECVKTIKKLTDCFPGGGILSGMNCYDHKGQTVNTRIEYDIRRLL